MIRVAIAGAGRMGQAIAAALRNRTIWNWLVCGAAGTISTHCVQAADVVIDFSLPDGTEQVLAAVARLGKPLVCGVSGLSEAQMAALDQAAAAVPVVYDRNMSLGVAVLEHSVREAAARSGRTSRSKSRRFTTFTRKTHLPARR